MVTPHSAAIERAWRAFAFGNKVIGNLTQAVRTFCSRAYNGYNVAHSLLGLPHTKKKKIIIKMAGLPYHISALYVVDLVRFRQFAAGDRLRDQYQGLSRDPNSLSNLDQDLPNNMIHQVRQWVMQFSCWKLTLPGSAFGFGFQVPIKSLPQDWLWCESWCSDETKAQAKTIDLCNNPKTKEPKLKAAVR